MSRNNVEDYAQRLYSRVPAHYRVYDAELGQPLLALLRVVGEQVSNVRQDLDALWDNFFIETCDDWVVPTSVRFWAPICWHTRSVRATAWMSEILCAGGVAKARQLCCASWPGPSACGRPTWPSSLRLSAGRRT